MEEDKVYSEVNSFSQLEDCSGEVISSQINNSENDNEIKHNCSQSKNCEETNEYSCLLGSYGQVVLWNRNSDSVISRFEFKLPSCLLSKTDEFPEAKPDKDGDLQVVRKNDLNMPGVLFIKHRQESTLDLVGEQVWRGALFLADFILENPDEFNEKCVLEVASGVGLTSIVASLFSKKVISTDLAKGDILDLISENFAKNKDLIKSEFHVKELDFLNTKTIDNISNLLTDVNIILASDVVYNNILTNKFFEAILYLMKKEPEKTLYISLEKRYVFTLKDMDTVAPCYEHFLTRLQWLKEQETDHISWQVKELGTNFTQRMFYEKTSHIVLWRIKTRFK